MEVTYIGHSGFLVETGDCYFIFDCYNGVLPPLRLDKPILVFASHAHQDHYAPKVFDLLHEAGVKNVTAVLSDDIAPEAYPRNVGEVTVIPVSCRRTYDFPCSTTVHTLRSTDEGGCLSSAVPGGHSVSCGRSE